MPPFRWAAGLAVVLLCLVTNCDTLKCYDTSMTSESCEAIDLWCIKFLNGSTITRGCANVYDYCSDEDPGCYPEREENGVTQKWCCCNKDLCNSVSTPSFVLSVFSFAMLFFWL